MKKAMWCLFVFVVLVLLGGSALAGYALHCKYDDMQLMWYGQTRVEWGILEYRCECPSRHAYWLDSADCSH